MAYRSYGRPNLTAIWSLIGVNLILFIVSLVVPEIIGNLGLNPALFLSKPWTILTSMFLHLSPWHILANMLTLFFFGRYLCLLLGQGRFLLVYFIGGLIGNGLYILLGPSITAIGASGAVFAVGGALAMMRPQLRVFVFPIPAPLPLWVAVIGGFLIISFFPNVAWQAHLGGLAYGLVMGYLFRRRERGFF